MHRLHHLLPLFRCATAGGTLLAGFALGGSACAGPVALAPAVPASGAQASTAAATPAAAAAGLPSVARPGPGDPSCARPVYPQAALRNGESGKVVLSYLIGLDGSVLDGKIARSSGSPELDRAAYIALAKCLYRMPDGATEPRWMTATFVWSPAR